MSQISVHTDDNGIYHEKCWICLGTAKEDPPNGESHDWKRPCECSLVAHETCLLSWINQAGAGQANQLSKEKYFTIPCPQCKSLIYICDKNSLSTLQYQLNWIQNGLSITARRFIYVNVITTLTSTLFVVSYSTLYMIGSYSVQLMCPTDMACQVLGLTRTLLGTRVAPVSFKRMFYIPLIPITLAISRGDSTFGRVLLNLIPFSVIDRNHGPLTLTGPRLIIAVLPYIRMAYDYFYDRTLAPWLWHKLVSRPIDHSNLEMLEVAEVNNDVGIQLEVQIAGDGALGNIENNRDGNNAELGIPNESFTLALWRWTQRINQLFRTILGPLPQETRDILRLITGKQLAPLRLVNGILLPYYGAGLGTLLSFIPVVRRLLPNKFTRSIVCGCLIVVLKDIFNIYTRAKLYDSGDKRHILNRDEVSRLINTHDTPVDENLPDQQRHQMPQDIDPELPLNLQQAFARVLNGEVNNHPDGGRGERIDDERLDIADMNNDPDNPDDGGNWNLNMQMNFAWE